MEINDAIKTVREWNEKFGHLDPDKTPKENKDEWAKDMQTRDLATFLVEEEFGELREAVNHNDRVETLDAIADILVTLFGLVCKAGLEAYVEPAFEEVMRSNWSKLGEDGKPVYYDNGKIAKGPRYVRPDLTRVLGEG